MRLLWVGRFERVKGLEYLIRAVSLLASGGRDVELELVGGGDLAYESDIRRQVEQERLGSRVNFTGSIPHGPALYARYRRADLFVLASLSEGTPKVIGEAFAHGLPAVTTSVGNLPALIRPGLGTLAPPADADALAKAIATYVDDPARIETEGRRCLKEAETLTVESSSLRLAGRCSGSSSRPAARTGLDSSGTRRRFSFPSRDLQ